MQVDQNNSLLPQPKPVTDVWRPELVRLPVLSRARLAFRVFAHGLLKLVSKVCLRVTAEGLENLPSDGPLLIVINHLGNADAPALVAALPFTPDALGKIELYDLPVLGKLMDWYGIIWLHRGRPDKRALRTALDGLAEGRRIIIAPEGRESLSGALEEGTGGAAFLAYRSGAPVLPIVVMGSENEIVYQNLKKFKRTRVHIRVGKMFRLDGQVSARREALSMGTRHIMRALADLLPERYRGEYS
ncbi:MAG TPA: lysophospholipid acyltransferase family protein [Anaerolineales bacterium]|nr:lysophospholipid acyltransferase family protein [Anaerolineales bacterium]